ncbi:hypothetical protein [Wolbachia endosymbiont of Chironomus riparius]|uniref:hypothetical protein n=1 Tax=Wolbachia endosymbiont of Chironomus riparius TaxID=2883238 RepID=UPI00209E7CDC|nr:hypothetical protein [Wolbachia endosymbiont of Chironomus riparius]
MSTSSVTDEENPVLEEVINAIGILELEGRINAIEVNRPHEDSENPNSSVTDSGLEETIRNRGARGGVIL